MRSLRRCARNIWAVTTLPPSPRNPTRPYPAGPFPVRGSIWGSELGWGGWGSPACPLIPFAGSPGRDHLLVSGLRGGTEPSGGGRTGEGRADDLAATGRCRLLHPSGRSLRLLAEIKERLLTTLPPTLTRSRRTPLIGPSAAGSGRAAPGERPGWDPVPRGAGKRPCAHRGAGLRSSAAGERRTSGGVSRFLPPEALRAPAEGPNLWVQRPDSEPGGRSLLLPHPRPSRNEGGKTTSAAERFSPVPSRPPPLPDLNEYEAPLRENAFFFFLFFFFI